MSLVGRGISRVFFQKASEEKTKGDLAHLVERLFQKLLMIALFPSVVLGVTGRNLFELVFGLPWSTAGIFAQILAPWGFFWFISF